MNSSFSNSSAFAITEKSRKIYSSDAVTIFSDFLCHLKNNIQINKNHDIIGKKENDFICRFLLSGKPLHWTHLGYFLFLPLVKDNLTSAVVLKKFSEVTNSVMETYFRWVNHKNLNGQQHGRRKGHLDLFCRGRKALVIYEQQMAGFHFKDNVKAV